ncbi:uncharacterized protein N0V89_009619 [Didymosphaeria variabile]|uniref:Uncharacterized protein n=1 Tax=Didymosphaeria variabile TaxID=1932322 RepID=A0A9W8XDV0_9PLEO|nr:uncharacterized protein N0V89_009619 [Didymosphaeria variabile]KAJ4348247.1 hypothetical protein N0V89_009619 [Didymosphaeria variabile]
MKAQAGKSAGDGEVASCVSNLIHAFTDGLNVFKRLRERRRKRRSKHKDRDLGAPSGAELQLSTSLRKGPLELSEKYASCYGDKGDKFAKGDAIAHASLVETLIKFNTGLVSIIASFLHQDSKHNDLHLDYKSLTSLSDISRREAVDSLNQLYQRLSQSQLQLHGRPISRTDSEKKRRSSSRQRSQGPTVARVSVKASGSSNQTQLAMVRPRNARKGSMSSSSTGSSKAPSMSVTSPYTSPPRSPLPEYSPNDPFPPQKAPAVKSNGATSKKPMLSIDTGRPTTWPQPKLTKAAPFTNPLPTPPEYFTMQTLPPHHSLPFSKAQQNVPRRRTDNPTPSTYTFASDSTKLGEIPQRNWTVPFNYEEAERLNSEAALKGHPIVKASADQKTKTRKGLRSLFKKGQTA